MTPIKHLTTPHILGHLYTVTSASKSNNQFEVQNFGFISRGLKKILHYLFRNCHYFYSCLKYFAIKDHLLYLRVFLPSVLSSVSHIYLIISHFFALRNSWTAFAFCFGLFIHVLSEARSSQFCLTLSREYSPVHVTIHPTTICRHINKH